MFWVQCQYMYLWLLAYSKYNQFCHVYIGKLCLVKHQTRPNHYGLAGWLYDIFIHSKHGTLYWLVEWSMVNIMPHLTYLTICSTVTELITSTISAWSYLLLTNNKHGEERQLGEYYTA